VKLRASVKAMTGISAGDAQAIAASLPFSRYQKLIDIGCAAGCVRAAIAYAHPHITRGGFDLPNVQPLFAEHVAEAGLTRRPPMAAPSSSKSRSSTTNGARAHRSADEPHMVIAPRSRLDYLAAYCECWTREVGFGETSVHPLAGPDAMVVGIK